MSRRWIYLLLCSLIVIGGPAAAEEEDRKRFDVIVNAQQALVYDDNITLVPDNEREDMISRTGLEIGVRREGKTNRLDFTGSLVQELYLDHDGLDHLSGGFDLNFSQELSRYDRVYFENSFLSAERPESFQTAFGRTDGRYAYDQNEFSGEYTHQFSSQFRIEAAYGNTYFDPDRDDIVGALRHSAELRGDYAVSSLLDVFLAYRFAETNFDPGAAIDGHRVYAGVQREILNNLLLTLQAGVDEIDTASGSFTEPNVKVELTRVLSDGGYVTVSLKQENTASIYQEDVFDFWQAVVTARRQLLRRLNAAATVFYGDGDFQISGGSQDFSGFETELFYELNKNTTTTLAYEFADFNSSVAQDNYQRNAVQLKVIYTF